MIWMLPKWKAHTADGTELKPSGVVTVSPRTERFIQTERSISSKAESPNSALWIWQRKYMIPPPHRPHSAVLFTWQKNKTLHGVLCTRGSEGGERWMGEKSSLFLAKKSQVK